MSSIVIDEKYEECRRLLKENISKKRYLHSIGVSNTSACLAMKYGADVYKAYLAGLLHDCAKGLSEKDLINTCVDAGIGISPIEKENPELLHSKAGSVLAKGLYNVNDKEILGAICYHTTGREGMTLLEKIVFVADYIEPNRTGLPELESLRETAFSDIDAAVCKMCELTLEHLRKNGKPIDKSTEDTYEYYRR